MGDTEQETLSNVTACDVDFDDECFDEVSDDAKDFIMKLLVRQEKLVNIFWFQWFVNTMEYIRAVE